MFCSLVCFSIAVYPVHVIEGDRKKVQSLTGQFYFLEENKLARCSYAERRNPGRIRSRMYDRPLASHID